MSIFDIYQAALETPPMAEKTEEANPLKDALRDAFEAVRNNDFESFSRAFESALTLHRADNGRKEETSSDAEPWELDELEV